jgi:uncharacterized SAM-binding protein YcdF (DUF218 family)
MIDTATAFLVRVLRGQTAQGDAIIVPTGDGTTRLGAAFQLVKMGYAPFVVISGGLDRPPYSLTADALARVLLGMGLAHDRVLLESESQNTREQAVNVIALAQSEQWSRLLLVANAYHLPRVFLTFLKAVQEAGLSDKVRLVPVVADAPWDECPAGREVSRYNLLSEEVLRIEEYAALGHCASCEDGFAALGKWESEP